MKNYLNMKMLILVIGLVLFFSCNRSPSVEWEKEFSSEILANATDIKQTDDGGYIILGTSNSYQLTLVKVDSIGNTLWVKRILEGSPNFANAIQLTNDGGYIIVGYHYSSNGNFWIAKLDRTANVLWSKEYDDGENREEVIAVECTEDGNYIVAGEKHYNTDSVYSSDYWIAKIDNEGELTWSKVLGGSNTDTPKIMRKTKNGRFVIEGITYSKDGDVLDKNNGRLSNSIWSIEVNDNGDLINSQLKSSFHLGGKKITLTDDGEYLLAGQEWVGDIDGSVDIFVEKRDINLNLIWSKFIAGSGKDESITIQQTNDGGYIVLSTMIHDYEIRQKLIKLGS